MFNNKKIKRLEKELKELSEGYDRLCMRVARWQDRIPPFSEDVAKVKALPEKGWVLPNSDSRISMKYNLEYTKKDIRRGKIYCKDGSLVGGFHDHWYEINLFSHYSTDAGQTWNAI